MKTPLILTAAAVCLAVSAPARGETADAAALSALQGTYESAGAEAWYGGYGTREFVFANGTWSLTFIHALDPDMTLRTFQFRTGGTYKVGAASEAVPGAFRTQFNEDWKHLTLLTPDAGLAEALGMGDCSLTVNLEADISATGCAAWRPVAVCGVDHDLFALDETGLRFGVRPQDNDMCTEDKTPTALLPAVVKRQPIEVTP
ncbi:hypothetical protein [Tabrizicola sp.]|uniref:hypothetical protein n=1 Tax=Tabrizicola sp. TaxID=2005166 RepID=UPI003F3D4761